MPNVIQFACAVITLGCLLCSCKDAPAPSPPKPKIYGKFDWLPKIAPGNDLISPDAQLGMQIPKDDPLKYKSTGWGSIDTFGNVSPKEKKDFQITGGSIITKLGDIEKRAKYGEIEFVYQDAALTQKSDRWAFCLTSGEIILPRSIFIDPPKDRFTPNSFSILPINEGYVLLSIDPAKSQRVCMLENADGSAYPTVGFNGTTVAYANKQYERKSDGWYEGQNKVSD